MVMVKLSLVLFVASAHGLHLAPALRSPLMTSRVPTPMLIDAPSDFSIDFIMDKVASFFASGDKKPVPPTAEEIAEYCRDPDSSGCDLDMVDALMAEAEKLKKAQPAEQKEPIRWSKEIDDAVFKCD